MSETVNIKEIKIIKINRVIYAASTKDKVRPIAKQVVLARGFIAMRSQTASD